MPIDIRANVTCSLGTLISASVNDDYVQGSGLIKTRGSCEISGLVSPAVGTVVTFNYTKSGVTRAVPRKLRVLSSFADPFRRTTKVELGCKLTYLQDLKDQIDWDAFDDPENAELTEEDAEIVTLPISAQSVANKCLLELGISASGLFLTNRFSIEKFDFSPGYVQILSDLLVSESRCGYLDYSERLVVFSLSASGGAGPSFGTDQIIDIGSINVGDLPGDAVTVSYSTLRLKASVDPEELDVEDPEDLPDPAVESAPDPDEDPDAYDQYVEDQQRVNWERDETISDPVLISVPLPDNRKLSATYTPRVSRVTSYTVIDGVEQVRSVIETTYSISGADYGNYLAGLVNGGAQVTVNAAVPTVSYTETSYTYSLYGSTTTRTEYEPAAKAFGAMNLPFVFGGNPPSYVLVGSMPVAVRKTVSITESIGSVSRTKTTFYKLWHETLQGQQAIAESSVNLQSASDVADYVNAILSTGPVFAGSEVSTGRTGQRLPARPTQADRLNQELADSSQIVVAQGDDFIPDYSTPSVSEIVLATGSRTAERRIELSMPYAPDDRFIRGARIAENPDRYRYFAVRSDAKTKASLFGRVQNRILFGNRNGMNIQTVPELLPNAPYAPFYVTANGVVTQYRTNGTSWTMDSNGIVASTDALYWGVVGRTA
jgi:hypothetical protein